LESIWTIHVIHTLLKKIKPYSISKQYSISKHFRYTNHTHKNGKLHTFFILTRTKQNIKQIHCHPILCDEVKLLSKAVFNYLHNNLVIIWYSLHTLFFIFKVKCTTKRLDYVCDNAKIKHFITSNNSSKICVLMLEFSQNVQLTA